MALGGLAQATLGRARSPAPVQTAAKISIEKTRVLARLLLRAVIDRSRLDEDLEAASFLSVALRYDLGGVATLDEDHSAVEIARLVGPLGNVSVRAAAASASDALGCEPPCLRQGPSRCARRLAGLRKAPQAASRTRPEGRRPNLPNSFFDSPKRHWNNKNSERASCYRTLPCAVSRLGSGIRRPWGRACLTRYGKPDEAADVRGFEAAGTLGRRRHQESARKWREPRRPPPNARQPNAAI